MIWRICIFLISLSLAYSKEVRIATFDGGGIRGVATLEILKNLENDTKIVMHQDFDVFAGTSTGSIIAVSLAIGIPMDEMIDYYVTMSSTVFADGGYSIFSPKYDREKLRLSLIEVLNKYGYNEESTLADLPKKVIIPTVRLHDPKLGRWRMELRENFTIAGGKNTILDTVMESTAAPTYFSSYENCVDGGIAINDPALAAYSCAFHPLKVEKNGLLLLSVGTGYFKKYYKEEENWGFLGWLNPATWWRSQGSSPLISLILDVEDQMPGQLLSLLVPASYQKIDFPLEKDVPLDDYQAIEALIKETDNYIASHPVYWEKICSWINTSF
ncbi:MAG: patatin-like phospholipase family protein [Chlamydiales bacterium]|nr:patatin-like phospholipase family protein [Chlamydiales bacterium]